MEKNILIYDLSTLPKSMTMLNIINGYKDVGVVVYCSSGVGNYAGNDCNNVPKVIDSTTLNDADGFKFIDTIGLSEDEIEKLIK